MKFKRTLLSLAVWGSLCATGLAQTMIENPSGFRTQVPAGFTVRQDANGAVASNASETTAIVVKAHSYTSLQAFAADANLQRDGFTLVGEPRLVGDNGVHFRASKPRPEGGYLIADTFVTFAPQGGGCLVVALSDEASAEAAYYSASEVVSHLQFHQPQATAASSAWDGALRGKHLVYLYTGNGYSERSDLYLHANGAFAMGSDMSSLSMNGSGFANGQANGTWQITPNGQLVLSYHDGRSKTYTLTPRQASNEVSLNGQRYFVMAQ